MGKAPQGASLSCISISNPFRQILNVKIHWTAGHHCGNGMLVHHLRHGVAQEHHILIERFDVAVQFDAIDEVDRDRNMLLAEQIQERTL